MIDSMKKYNIFIIVSMFLFLLLGCNSSSKLEGTYELVIKRSDSVQEFSTDYELLKLDGNGNFTIDSYYERTYYMLGSYSMIFAGELVTNIKGKYYIKGNKIELEWFVNELSTTETYEFDSNGIFKATYYSDGTFNSKTEEYLKIHTIKTVNLDGSYELNLSRSKTIFFVNSSKYKSLTIEGSTFTFRNAIGNVTVSGNLLLGTKNALLLQVVDFTSYEPVIIVVTDEGIDILLGYSYKYSFDKE